MEKQEIVNILKAKFPKYDLEKIGGVTDEILEVVNRTHKAHGLFPSGFVLGSYLAKRLGLNAAYFSKAYHSKDSIEAEIIKFDTFILVKIEQKIIDALEDNYIACRINKCEADEYDFIYQLSKNCLLGFYK